MPHAARHPERRRPIGQGAVVARALMLALLAALTGAAPGRTAEVGLSDQNAATWSDARVRALGLHHARLVVPWDAATSEPERVRAWLDAVAAAGLRPHVAFERARGSACPSLPCHVPTRAEYAASARAFLARFPEVTTFTTWNEANHLTQPVENRPEMVAAYYEELRAACPRCTIVAAGVLDWSDYIGWLERFRAATDPDPQLWGLHNYPDATYGRTTGTDRMLDAVPGRLWIEETGGIVSFSLGGLPLLPYDEDRASRAVSLAFAIARGRSRIGRVYVYHWRAGAREAAEQACFWCPYFDAGLVRPDGTTRPSYRAMLAAVRHRRAAGPDWHSWWAGRHLKVKLTCRGADRCRGRVRIVLQTRRGRAGRWRARRLATRRYDTAAGRRTATMRIRVSRALRRRARRARRQRIALTVLPIQPRARASRVVVALR
jgi:hypothetical protein